MIHALSSPEIVAATEKAIEARRIAVQADQARQRVGTDYQNVGRAWKMSRKAAGGFTVGFRLVNPNLQF
jgi:hypothetical protein